MHNIHSMHTYINQTVHKNSSEITSTILFVKKTIVRYTTTAFLFLHHNCYFLSKTPHSTHRCYCAPFPVGGFPCDPWGEVKNPNKI